MIYVSDVDGSCSTVRFKYPHTTTKQSTGLTTPTIGNMIQLHSLLFGGQNGDLQDNLHLFLGWQKQMQQMQHAANASGQARKQ